MSFNPMDNARYLGRVQAETELGEEPDDVCHVHDELRAECPCDSGEDDE